MKTRRIVFLLFAALLVLPAEVHAYIDPGTGSLILQALAATGITALAFVRGIREKIASFFKWQIVKPT